MNKLALILAAAVLAAVPASAGGYFPGAGRFPVEDHLEPVMTATQAAVIDDKSAAVELILFKEAFADNVRARIRTLITPAFYETMTFVTEDNGSYHLVYLYSERWIGEYVFPPITGLGHPPQPLPDPQEATVIRNEVTISPSLATAIIADWKKLLLLTRYSAKHHTAFDGAVMTLSMEDETGVFAGQTWSPGYDLPILNALQTAAFDMVMFCGYGKPTLDQCIVADTATLEKDVDELTKVLQLSPP
jgi:hypothetical protein